MKKYQLRQICAALGACGLLTLAPVMAAPLPLAQAPAGSITVTPPAPNLILTIDNSNSMNNRRADPGQVGSRMQNLRAALQTAFSETNLPDGAIRLGWNTINPLDWDGGNNWGPDQPRDCSEFRTAGPACGPQGNMLRPLTAAHRANFLQWVGSGQNSQTITSRTTNGLQGFGNTPTLHGYFNALKQFDLPATNINSPWAEVPGSRAGEYLTCRKSYVMLLTDGDYNTYDAAGILTNGSADLDSQEQTLGDGITKYDPTLPYANIYKQTQTTSHSNFNHLEQLVAFNNNFNTISDLAFHYWAKDADGNSSNNNVAELWRVTTDENGIDKFWNPKNNPATWQHVSTYTVGYGATAAGWDTSPKLAATETLHDSEDLKRLMLGTSLPSAQRLSWPSQTYTTVHVQQEMMHAALNGRGKFYPARTQQDLVEAIKDMLDDVIAVPEQHVTSASGSTLSAQVESSAFYTSYDSEKWRGDVTAVTLKVGGGVDENVKPWGTNTAASLLDARPPNGRSIFTSQVNLAGPAPVWTGKTFEWANLSADQQAALRGTATVNATTTALGTSRLNYLRGVRTDEGTTFRERQSVLGDIVNSSVWFMKGVPNAGYTTTDYLAFTKAQRTANRTDALFVGANDGMLHAFDADNGNELFAYVPMGAYANLASLTTTTYAHKYFVDGSPFTADYCKAYDADDACTTWGTALVGFMGAGGKGFFVLDVTDPTSMAASNVLMDSTTGYLPGDTATDPDIGHITQKPVTEKGNPLATRQIARMNNGKWALVTGNGYNSADEKAVLVIQYLDGSKAQKIYATTVAGQGNGLSAPRLIDLNGDSRPDVAYAGDLKGNLYKFDLSSTDASEWKVAGNTAMFTAKSDSGAVQPITTAPVYQVHPTKGLMVVFGTGQSLTVADRSDITKQSFYGLYDFGFVLKTTNPYAPGGVEVKAPANMNQASWSPLPGSRSTGMLKQTANATTGITSRNLDVASVGMNAMGTTYRGWYMDLPVERERVLRNPRWFDGDLLDLLSDVPAVAPVTSDPCQVVDTSAAAYYTTVMNAVTGNAPTADVWADQTDVNRQEGELAEVDTRTDDKAIATCVGPDCETHDPTVRNLLGRYFKTPSWRQMQ